MNRLLPVLLAAIVGGAALAQQSDVAAVGPSVGSAVPDFSGVDQTGQTRTLASVLGPNGAMIVFYRSADW